MTQSKLVTLTLAALACAPCFSQNPGPERLAEVEIRPQRIADDLYVLFGYGGNIAVQLGEQGILLVDTQFPELVPKVRAAIAQVSNGEIEFAINTHWHYDHTEGNQGFGPQGVWFIAQTESQRRLTVDNMIDTRTRPAFPQPTYPIEARPIVSFDDRLQLHFNGEQIDLLHFGPAHTAGDAAVIFRRHNAVHMGDVFLPAGYPFVDAANGGDLDGMIAFCRAVMSELDEDAVVIPGHGPVATWADLAQYTQMLQSVRDRIAALIESGATLEQVIAAKPTAAWDEIYGNPAAFIDRAYLSLTR